MRRREFIGLLGAAGAALSLPARAQQADGVRQIGVLMSTAAEDSAGQARIAAFLRALEELGWADRRNLRIDVRWTTGRPDTIRKHAAELVAQKPELIVATGSSTLGPLLGVTRSVPIVFVHVPDPVGAGFVDSLARPGGNATGFVSIEYGIGAKWLELLKQVAPGIKRVGVVRDPAIAAGAGQFGAILAVAPNLGVDVSPINVRNPAEIERGIAAFARTPDTGLVVTGSSLAVLYRKQIVALAARHRLPAVYFERFFVTIGGLMSYAPDLIDQYRRAAQYVDRILKGQNVSELPVQLPTKYELVVNLATAKSLGLTIPQALLVSADEMIE